MTALEQISDEQSLKNCIILIYTHVKSIFKPNFIRKKSRKNKDPIQCDLPMASFQMK